MERRQVDSTNISSIGYDEDLTTLEVEFHNGSVYQYLDVPLHVFEGLRDADSKGKHFAQHIKGYYRYVKV